MIKSVLKYKFFILFIALLAIQTVYKKKDSEAIESKTKFIQSKLLDLDKKSNNLIDLYEKRISKSGLEKIWEKPPYFEERFKVHVYRNDSLLFWNTNSMPINRFSDDLHYPVNGVVKAQNGWYYAVTRKKNGIKICCSFLIKNEYSYQNEDLVNSFSKSFGSYDDVKIVVDEEQKNKVFGKNKEYLFSLISKEKKSTEKTDIMAFSLLFLSLVFFFLAIYDIVTRSSSKLIHLIPVGLIVARFLLLVNEVSIFGSTPTISYQNTGVINYLNPDIGSFVFNSLLFMFLFVYVFMHIKKIKTNRIKSLFLFIFGLLFSYFFWFLIVYLFSNVVIGTRVPFVIDHLFELNYFSFLIIALIGLLFYSYYRGVSDLLTAKILDCFDRNKIAFYLVLIGGINLILGVFVFEENLISLITPIILTLYVLFKSSAFSSRSVSAFFVLFFCSLFVSIKLFSLTEQKSNEQRRYLANYLATEKQEETEKQYAKIASQIKDETFIKRLIKGNSKISISDFEEMMEGKYFNDYWESYEIKYNLFSSEGISFFTKNNKGFKELNLLIKEDCERSKFDQSIYYVRNYKSQLSYLIRQEIEVENNQKVIFTAKLKSKKIPEGIGFPRLLISSKTPILEYIDKYSFAKYHKGKLVSKHGQYSYPSRSNGEYNIQLSGGITKDGGHEHFIFNKSGDNLVIVSKKESTILEIITRFSYLFAFFGFVLLVYKLLKGAKSIFEKTITLSVRIQIVLVFLVFSSLFAFGWGSGIFIKDQYKKNTSENVKEKLVSLEIELRAKLGEFDKLSIENDANYMEYVLSKLSRVFVTDINLYAPDGHLLSSSRPKVFNKGLMGEQINPQAFHMLRIKNKSDFSQKERIGKLDYTSAYLPFYNSKGDLLAYVNLQHFGQQKELENQIQEFLVAIINVFILLLVISVIISVFISNWVTKPLRVLHENISSIQFGQGNQKIEYNKQDEIGALVRQYNQKLEELAITAEQLAKSERESAWRDMAKQVAHEIKNPLTPMKLSIQQFVRVFDKEDPKSAEKLQKVANSLIEQIDGLSKIANEFSAFAKMPLPEKKEVDLYKTIESVISIFQQKDKLEFKLKKTRNEAIVFVDKDQILRVFNNLIKNAVQSISKGEKGEVEIEIDVKANDFLISIKDNGHGMSEEQKQKIFIPYFTTKTTGTGIGLPIAKKIIENHNGTINYESELNIGTTFFVQLPKHI
ncbi:MAG: HAMP domain-containing sensor histidine kinase [Crocinitomicaceae bacterium]|nr:HAMP domain-containing sensor histidine kinase [Crocinitomicaceae bacterium]